MPDTDMKALEQWVWIGKNKFEIQDKGLRMYCWRIGSKIDHIVPYEIITSRRSHVQTRQNIWLGIAIITFLSGITAANLSVARNSAAIVLALIGVISGVIYYFAARDEKILITANNQAVPFAANNPDSGTVDDYIDEVIKARNAYLIRTYTDFDPIIPYEQQATNLRLLYDYEAISKEEYTTYGNELKRLMNVREDRPVGFRSE